MKNEAMWFYDLGHRGYSVSLVRTRLTLRVALLQEVTGDLSILLCLVTSSALTEQAHFLRWSGISEHLFAATGYPGKMMLVSDSSRGDSAHRHWLC